MTIAITGRSFNITENIKAHTEDGIEKHILKFFDQDATVSIKVVLSKDAHLFNTSISINDNHGEFIKVSAAANNAYNSIDGAIVSLSGKLRKYKKERISKYRNNKDSLKSQVKARGYLLDGNNIDEEDHDNKNKHPLIIEENDIVIKTLSLSEAIMEMDLLSIPALLFINVNTNKINMIYIRDDGNITWVDPSIVGDQ